MKKVNMVICTIGKGDCYLFKSRSKFVKTIICPNIKISDSDKNLLPLLVDDDFLPIDKNYTVLKNCVIYKGTIDDINVYDSMDDIKKVAESYAAKADCPKITLSESEMLPVVAINRREYRHEFITSIKKELCFCDLIYHLPFVYYYLKLKDYKEIIKPVYKYITIVLMESGVSQIYIKSSEISIKENSNKYIRWVDEYKTYSEKDLNSTIGGICDSRDSYVLYDLDNKTKIEHL